MSKTENKILSTTGMGEVSSYRNFVQRGECLFRQHELVVAQLAKGCVHGKVSGLPLTVLCAITSGAASESK
eukprot:4311031-Amphidinium_carterae.1